MGTTRKGSGMFDIPEIGKRVRVNALDACNSERPFLYCSERPEPCQMHGGRHSGEIYLTGHDPMETDQVGEIVSVRLAFGGEVASHPWIVRFDQNLTMKWPNGHQAQVNGGAYSSTEIEFLQA